MIGYTYADHNPDSWEGWHWGGMHQWGFSHRLGIPEQYDLLEDALKHTEMIVFWSSDPETTSGIYAAFESTCRRQWLKDLGVKMVFIDPFYNHTAGLYSDKWLAPRPGTGNAMACAIAYVWLTENLYDQGIYSKLDPWALKNGKTISWARKTAYRRRPSGPKKKARFPPGRSKRWPGNGHPRRPCWLPVAWVAGGVLADRRLEHNGRA